MTGNPFSITFGKKPEQYISRERQINEVIDTFNDRNPAYQVCMVTGVRGAGKTVMLSDISGRLREDRDWIVMDLNPEKDLLISMASRLYAEQGIFKRLKKTEFSATVLGVSLTVEGEPPVTDAEAVIELLLEKVKQQNRKVLITIDEVTGNAFVRAFAASFQIFLRHEYPVFLVMTGLYENISDLQNGKSLTFLYRAPKMTLAPLSLSAIQESYRSLLGISEDLSIQMSKLTRGYPFAYQALGYIYWKKNGVIRVEELLAEYDSYLDDYVYQKIWHELSEKEKSILRVIAEKEPCRVAAVREKLGLSAAYFGVYRDRLKKKGLIDTSTYGHLSLFLPRFGHFVNVQL